MAFTDQAVLEQAQYTMLEPPDGGQTWDSDLWTLEEVSGYLTQRQNRLLKNTHLQVGIADITVTAGTAVFALPDDWINTIGVVYTDSGGNTIELMRSDTWEADYGIPTWSYVQATPKLYSDADTEPLTIRIMPVPDDDGTLQIYYVPLGAPLDGSGELMTVPDEFVPSVKYGLLSDMFAKVGRAHDPGRAKYCQDRFSLGIELGNLLLGGWKR
jgi:hypothetical protein